ncbi:MAG: glycosyltransferase family 39 protein [bacterium]|nr:glycosyltransferase family 39 protein [bacterium]
MWRNKINWMHLLLIGSLPIILALINPNWIFNVGIADDYIYLGYQLNFPKYVGWFPSSEHYFIERFSWIFPAYGVRQLFSPLIGNFVVHLGVYYLAIFSVYGTLNRLFNARVALLTALLMGQCSLFLRATGWDYVDGYTLALFALCVCLLTYASQSPRYRWYLCGAGISALFMVNVQVFSLFYTPALAIYYLIINHYGARRHIIHPILWGGIGVVLALVVLSVAYYRLTGRGFIFANTLATAQGAVGKNDWRNLINNHLSAKDGTPFAFLFLLAGAMAIGFMGRGLWIKASFYRYQHAIIALFTGSLGVFAFWSVLGYTGYLRLTFYSSLLLPSTFLFIGAVFIARFNTLSVRAVWLVYAIILITFTLFHHLLALPIEIFVISAGLLWFMGIWMKGEQALLLMTTALCLMSFVGGARSETILVYEPRRLITQHIYDTTTQASQIIDQRYTTYSSDQFRFWFPTDTTLNKEINSVTALYLFGWGRFITPFNRQVPQWDNTITQSKDIILLTAREDAQTFLADLNQFLAPRHYELVVIDQYIVNDVFAITFTQLKFLSPVTQNRVDYDFNSTLADESGLGAPETVNERTFRWTSESTARMRFTLEDGQFDPTDTYQVQFLTLSPLEIAVQDSLKVTINGTPLVLERIPQGADTLFQAEIGGDILNNNVLEIIFETNGISRPADFGYPDPRTLGVALDWLTIEPIEE